MTTYQGGKKRLGKRISYVIKLVENDLYNERLDYFEPFVGMAGVIRHFSDENRKLYANDINKDIILMWKAIQNGWKPPLSCSKEEYEKLKLSKHHSAKRGFIGTVASWGGIFFHHYRLDYNKNKDFLREGYNGLMKIKPYIMNIDFIDSSSYDTFNPEGFLIYCDPPYKGNKLGISTSYFQSFDHSYFWNVMRKWSKNNLVIISESIAPKDFKKIWSSNSTASNTSGSKKYKDNLYVYKTIYDNISKTVIKDIRKL